MEYEWLYLIFRRNKPGEAHHWELYETCLRRRTLGKLMRGTRRNRGWHVLDAGDRTIAVLPPELNTSTAQAAAKTILLSLKQSEESS